MKFSTYSGCQRELSTVATVCGVERSLLERAYGAFAATGAVEGAGKVLAGPGLVQHGTGSALLNDAPPAGALGSQS